MLYLHEQGHTVSVVTPARIKGFAQSQMLRNKTDKQDTATLAACCAQTKPDAWRPPTPAQRKLRALMRHRDDLIAPRIQQTNHLQDTTDADVRAALEVVIATIEAQLLANQQHSREHLKANTDLREVQVVMDTVGGIGESTAQKLLAEVYDLGGYQTAKAAAADAGLTPATYEEGTSVRRRPKLSKVGKATVRAALSWPAIAAMTHSPHFKGFAERLAARGKSKGVIRTAVMGKVLHIIYGVVKHKTLYDPTKVLGAAI